MKKVLATILSLVMVFTIIPATALNASAATFDDINQSSVFVKQQTNYTCTLASAVMVVRRASMMAGKSNWASVTESSMRGTAWVENSGLKWSFTYNGISVGHANLSGNSSNKSTLISILANHPEGVVAYNGGISNQWHAVILTDYTNGTFYCADPAGSTNGRVPLTSSTIVGSGQDGKISNFTAYWYVTSPKVTLTQPVHTHDYKLVWFWASHPHYNEYKCSCGASYVDYNSVNYYDKCEKCKQRVINDGWYKIASATNTDYVVDVQDTSMEDSHNVHLWSYVNGNNQKVYFKYVGDGYYTIKFKHSGKMLDVCGGTKASRTNVQQYEKNGTDAQKWVLLSAENSSYYLKSKLGDFYLDLPENKVENGNSIWIYNKNYSAAQKWKIIEVEHSLEKKKFKKATYFANGYTGVKVCKTCGKTISNGKIIKKLKLKTPKIKIKTAKNKFRVTYKKVKNATGFQMRYCVKGKMKVKTFNTKKTVTKTIKSNKKIKKHTIQIRAFIKSSKKKAYSAWSKIIGGYKIKKQVQYRFKTKTVKTSKKRKMKGYKRSGSNWKYANSGSIDYVESFPSGFNKNNWIYNTYNKTPKVASTTSKSKTVVSTSNVGYVYYHWCRGDHNGLNNRRIEFFQSKEFNSFHAFVSASPLSFYQKENAFKCLKGDVCDSTYWWNSANPNSIAIKRCSYTVYNKLNVFYKWSKYSSWSSKRITANANKKVQKRIIYSYIK